MGQTSSTGEEDGSEEADRVGLTNFEILRNIGRGSFGKVCIVQKIDNKKLYAMKYISKIKCIEQDAFRSVVREVTIMCELDHPFLVNLWFSFEDDDYFFQVFDLFMGGDLRYHLGQQGVLGSDQVKLYVLELGLALDYLRQQKVVHRDVKPDNILLDDEGHAHLTDFNIATTLTTDSLATSESGTKPYMAPELLGVQLRQSAGYSYAVDWWSLGVAGYEMVAGTRPYPIRSNTNAKSAYEIIMDTMIPLPSNVEEELARLLAGLLSINEKSRISSVSDLQNALTTKLDFKSTQAGGSNLNQQRAGRPPMAATTDQRRHQAPTNNKGQGAQRGRGTLRLQESRR